jgi:hypothetical protein
MNSKRNNMKTSLWLFSKNDLNSLYQVRTLKGLEIASENDFFWVRSSNNEITIESKIKQLPSLNSYRLDGQNFYFAIKGLTPLGKLNDDLKWELLKDFMKVTSPVSAMPAVLEQKLEIRLVASEKEQIGVGLIIEFEDFINYVENAPEIRLKNLNFAVSQEKQVILIGNPLPPIQGREYWKKNQILLPSGFDFSPSILATLIEQKLNPRQEYWLIFFTDGSWQNISKNHFKQLSRSAARLTQLKIQ